MGNIVQRIPLIQVDALPSLCSYKTCLNDRISGSQFCEKHDKISFSLRSKQKHKIYKTADYCWIYFISSGNDVKIGMSKDVAKRLNTLQMASPAKLVLEAAIEAYEALEFVLHDAFKASRQHGEWFKRTSKLDEIINLAKQNDLKAIEKEVRFLAAVS